MKRGPKEIGFLCLILTIFIFLISFISSTTYTDQTSCTNAGYTWTGTKCCGDQAGTSEDIYGDTNGCCSGYRAKEGEGFYDTTTRPDWTLNHNYICVRDPTGGVIFAPKGLQWYRIQGTPTAKNDLSSIEMPYCTVVNQPLNSYSGYVAFADYVDTTGKPWQWGNGIGIKCNNQGWTCDGKGYCVQPTGYYFRAFLSTNSGEGALLDNYQVLDSSGKIIKEDKFEGTTNVSYWGGISNTGLDWNWDLLRHDNGYMSFFGISKVYTFIELFSKPAIPLDVGNTIKIDFKTNVSSTNDGFWLRLDSRQNHSKNLQVLMTIDQKDSSKGYISIWANDKLINVVNAKGNSFYTAQFKVIGSSQINVSINLASDPKNIITSYVYTIPLESLSCNILNSLTQKSLKNSTSVLFSYTDSPAAYTLVVKKTENAKEIDLCNADRTLITSTPVSYNCVWDNSQNPAITEGNYTAVVTVYNDKGDSASCQKDILNLTTAEITTSNCDELYNLIKNVLNNSAQAQVSCNEVGYDPRADLNKNGVIDINDIDYFSAKDETLCATQLANITSPCCQPGQCLVDKKCIPAGIRITGADNLPAYCDISGQIKTEKQLNSDCQNNYECKSNECSSGKCVSSIQQIGGLRKLLIQILCFIEHPTNTDAQTSCINSYTGASS